MRGVAAKVRQNLPFRKNTSVALICMKLEIFSATTAIPPRFTTSPQLHTQILNLLFVSPHIITMGVSFDYAPERPEHIEAILNGLDRYNPETTSIFQDYVQHQCDEKTYDCYANLALLKLYVISRGCRT